MDKAELVVTGVAIPGLPGFKAGDVARRIGSQIVEGYEYDVYEIAYGRSKIEPIAKVRVDHREELTVVYVDFPLPPKQLFAELRAISDEAVRSAQ